MEIQTTFKIYSIKTASEFLIDFDFQIQQIMEEHNVCETTSRSAAAISLTFIVLVTPWAIQQVITSCTGTNVSKFFIFINYN